MALQESILDTIGGTPIVRLQRISPSHATIYAKVESFNPGGSVKDRLALGVVLDAESRGELTPVTPSSSAHRATSASRSPWSPLHAGTSSSP